LKRKGPEGGAEDGANKANGKKQKKDELGSDLGFRRRPLVLRTSDRVPKQVGREGEREREAAIAKELEAEGDEVLKQLRDQQREVIDSLDLKQAVALPPASLAATWASAAAHSSFEPPIEYLSRSEGRKV
jgi:hypothetical protein